MRRVVNRSILHRNLSTKRLGSLSLNRSKAAVFAPSTCKLLFRNVSSDSHDDFKPKKKVVVPEGLEDVTAMIDEQVKSNPVMLYMKGTPARPQCGFSMQAVRILNAIGVEFSSGEFRYLFHPLHSSFNQFLLIILLFFTRNLMGRLMSSLKSILKNISTYSILSSPF